MPNSTLNLTSSDFTPPASKISHFYLLSIYFLWERFLPKDTGLVKENLPSPLSQALSFFSKGSPIVPSHAVSLQIPAVVAAQQCSSQPGWCPAETLTDPPPLSPFGLGTGLYIAFKQSNIFFFLGNYHTSRPLAGRNNFKMGKIPLCQHSAQERTFNSCPCNSSLCPLHEEKLGTLQTDAWAQAIASALQKAAGVSGIVRYQHSQLHGSGRNAVTEILNENGKKLYFQHNIKAI